MKTEILSFILKTFFNEYAIAYNMKVKGFEMPEDKNTIFFCNMQLDTEPKEPEAKC